MKKITRLSNLAWNWLVFSSHDSGKISATVKGSIAFAVVSTLATVFHVQGLSDVLDQIINFVLAVSKACAAVYTLYGAIRKVHRTATNNNEVLNDPQLTQ